jgi:glycosyltransferase involved in cell wall biosynthesis
VLHVINGEFYSGAERVQDLLALRLPEFGYQVGFACVKAVEFPRRRKSPGVPLFEVPMRGRFDLRSARRLKQIICQEGYELVHAHTPRSLLVGRVAAMGAGVPLVYHVHSPASRDTTHRWRNLSNAVIERLCLLGAAQLIAVSESLGRHVRGQGLRRVTVVHNGVPEVPGERCHARPAGAWTVGTVALFRPRKGIEVLLEALAILRCQQLPVRLRAVGRFETPQYEAELKRRAVDLRLTESIDWVGFRSDVNAELQQMDLFALPSLFGEGLPMVVLEAMACGLPVVASNVEGVPEAIRHGEEGLLAAPGDAADLARCLARCIRGEVDYDALARSAKQRHAAHFSDRAMAAGVAAVYGRVLKRVAQPQAAG